MLSTRRHADIEIMSAAPPGYCALTRKRMDDPFVLPSGRSYEGYALDQWEAVDNRHDPVSGQPVDLTARVRNHGLREVMRTWREPESDALPMEQDGPLGPGMAWAVPLSGCAALLGAGLLHRVMGAVSPLPPQGLAPIMGAAPVLSLVASAYVPGWQDAMRARPYPQQLGATLVLGSAFFGTLAHWHGNVLRAIVGGLAEAGLAYGATVTFANYRAPFKLTPHVAASLLALAVGGCASWFTEPVVAHGLGCGFGLLGAMGVVEAKRRLNAC